MISNKERYIADKIHGYPYTKETEDVLKRKLADEFDKITEKEFVEWRMNMRLRETTVKDMCGDWICTACDFRLGRKEPTKVCECINEAKLREHFEILYTNLYWNPEKY